MKSYRLKKSERDLFRSIDEPFGMDGYRLTKPIVATFDKKSGLLVGFSSLKRWREIIRWVPEYIAENDFELRNMWI